MDLGDVLVGAAVAITTLIPLTGVVALALVAFFTSRRLRGQLAVLGRRIATLENSLLRLTDRFDQLAPPAAEAATVEVVPPPVRPQPALTVDETPITADEAATPQETTASATPEAAISSAAVTSRRSLEQLLVEHWLVWLGGTAIALGGAFLVKLSIDQGLLTPLVRVMLGVVLGIMLSVGAEWILRHDRRADAEAGTGSYVPQALAAAGAATIFASLYAAYALYGFFSAVPAFVLLAATAGSTVAQSLRHGPFVAALGLVGAYIVPMLVTGAEPHAVPLFAYLAIVTAGSLALLRHREWWWLAWLSVAGSTLWIWLWLASVPVPETPVVAVYLLVQLCLFGAFRQGIPRVGFLAGRVDNAMVRIVTRTAFWTIAAGLVLLAHADRFGGVSIGSGILAAFGLMTLAFRDRELDDGIAAAGALAVVLLASWQLPALRPDLGLGVFRNQPDHIARFTTAAIVFTLLLGAGGFIALPRVSRPGRWAALSAAVPLVVLVIVYWRLQEFGVDIAWSLTALALAGLELGAATTVAKRRDGASEIEIALAAYAVGVIGCTIVAATFALGEAWLTVALALHLPAMGWVVRQIQLRALRWLALGVAAVVLIRLVLNPYVLNYPLGPTPIFNWLLYGYGVPAASFIVATRQFGSTRDDLLVAVLEAGSALFMLLLLSLELTHALYGGLTRLPLHDFAAGAALLTLWLAFGGVLLVIGERRRRPVLRWAGLLLLGLGTLIELQWQSTMLVTGVRVGNLAILDALLLADAAPALIYATVAWQPLQWPLLRTIARVLATVFAFVWISSEIRHVFQGNVRLFASSSEVEWYTYSLAWLALAGAGLALGLMWRDQWLRRAGLSGIALVVAKVFLSDTAELSGVLRALSFLGLGGALVGLGYTYRRLRPERLPQS